MPYEPITTKPIDASGYKPIVPVIPSLPAGAPAKTGYQPISLVQSPASIGTANSTQRGGAQGTLSMLHDLGDYLFKPDAEIAAPKLPFSTKAEQASAASAPFVGPRIITGPVKILSDLLTGVAEAIPNSIVRIREALATAQGKDASTQLPFNPERIGIPNAGDNKTKPLFNEALDRLNELDQEKPNTPTLNLLQSFVETVLPQAILGPLITGDVLAGATRSILNLTKSSPELGISAAAFRGLTPKEAISEAGVRFVNRAQQIVEQYSFVDAVGKRQLTSTGRQAMSKLVGETRAIGQAFSDETLPELNALGRFFDDMSIRLNQDVGNLGQSTGAKSAFRMNPADETLPGSRVKPGQPFPMGASTQPIEPVGRDIIPPEQQALAEEARKYKSAEEFAAKPRTGVVWALDSGDKVSGVIIDRTKMGAGSDILKVLSEDGKISKVRQAKVVLDKSAPGKVAPFLTDFYKKAVGESAPAAEVSPGKSYSQKAIDIQKQSDKLNTYFKQYDRTRQSLEAALANPEGHAKAYGPGKVEQYKATLTDLTAKIQAIDPNAVPAPLPSPTAGVSENGSGGPQGGQPAGEGSGVGDPALARKLTNKLEVLLTERDMHQEALLRNPARELAKYADKNGNLPETLGGTDTIFGKSGDEIAANLGFEDSESARHAYENFKKQKVRTAEFDKQIAETRNKLYEAKSVDRDVSSLERFLNSSARKDDLAQSAMTKKMLAEPETAAQLAERQRVAKDRMVEIIQRMYKTTSPAERETPQFILQLTEEAYNLTHDEFQKISADDPTKLIHIDTSTPVNKKIGLHDWFRTPDRVLTKIGLGGVTKKLRHASEAAMLELPAHIDLISHWADEAAKISPNSNKQIFKYLDGQKTIKQNYNGKWVPLLPSEMKIATEIRKYLGEWADRLGLPADSKISHYITHIFGIGEVEKEFDEEMAKIIADKIPGSVYDPFLEKRLGRKGYIEDTFKALDAYAKRAVRKANMDPALKLLKEAAEGLEKTQQGYVKTYADLLNMRPTIVDEWADNMLKSIPGIEYRFGSRPTAVITRFLRQMVYRSTLGLNFHSAIKNLSQGVNTFAKLGPKYTAMGYTRLLTQAGSKELEDSGVLKQDIIQDKTLSATKKTLQKFDKALFYFFELTEKVNRGAAYFGAKQKGVDLGMDEKQAMDYAKKIVRDTQFSYGSIDTPVAMNNDIAKLFTQFLTYPIKQMEFAVEMVQNKEFAGILRYILASLFMVYVVGKVFDFKGRDFIPGSAFIPGQGFGQDSRIGNVPAFALPLSIVSAIAALPGSVDTTRGPRGGKSGLEKTIQDIGGKIPIPASVQAKNLWKWWYAKTPASETSGVGLPKLPKLPKLPSLKGTLPKLPKVF